MPLNTNEKQGLRDEAIRQEIKAVKPYLDKLMDARPPTGDPTSRDYILALGVLWYTFLGGLKSLHGDKMALQEDLEANLVAAFLAPEIVSLPEAMQRALDFYQMADPAAKG